MPLAPSHHRPLVRAALVAAAAALAGLASPALAQEPARAPAPSPAQPTLKEGTAIQLATQGDLSSETAKEGDPVALTVAQAVVVDGVTIIPAGAPASGQVAKARDNGLLGRSGKLDIAVTGINAGGREIPVRGSSDKKGKGGTIGAVGAGVVFLPLAIVVRGKEAKIPAGTKVDVYVDRDIPVILGSATPPAEQPIMAPAPASAQ